MRSNGATSYKLIERPIYGSSRVGIDNTPLELIGYTAPTSGITTNELGLKQYELTNHLGNVLTTVSDKKIPVDIGNNGTIDYYVADITSATDYYPFGSPMDGRTFSSEMYRFGFNGKEKDDEIKGDGNSYDFGARIYDSRLGRWLSLDPLQVKYPSLSAYNFCANNPIIFIDPSGMEIEEGSQAEWDKQKQEITKKKDELTEKYLLNIYSGGLLFKEEADNFKSIENTLKTMDIMENSTTKYAVLSTSGTKGDVYYNKPFDELVVRFKSTANFIHEITHCGQFEKKELMFVNDYTGGALGSVSNEIEAYAAQASFDKSTLPSSTSSSPTLSIDWLLGIKYNGSFLYQKHAKSTLTPTSKKKDLQKAYPSENYSNMKDHETIIDYYNDLYYKK